MMGHYTEIYLKTTLKDLKPMKRQNSSVSVYQSNAKIIKKVQENEE